MWTMIRIYLIALLCLSVVRVSAQEKEEDPCAGGTCPSPPDLSASYASSCGMWMGPSPIKQHEEHGFGLGLFTNRPIAKGSLVDATVLIPVWDWDGDERHPPLREYLWKGENVPGLSMTSKDGIFVFMAGAGAFAPCTSDNFNLETVDEYIEESPPPILRSSPAAGSYAPWTSHFYRAVRDIAAGEELTVECSDDDFDGGAYELERFQANEASICVDDSVRVEEGSAEIGGKTLTAKRFIAKGERVLSTPVVPLDRSELAMKKDNQYQLLLNYCIGHEESDLLFLPVGPMANYINHGGENHANVAMQWHQPPPTAKTDDTTTRRMEYHHWDELSQLSASQVAQRHGHLLVLDYVATTDIAPGQEILLDYGPSWQAAWEEHVALWKSSIQEARPLSAAAFEEQQPDNMNVLRTVAEQFVDPYPSNIMFGCMYSEEWADPPDGVFQTVASYYDDFGDETSCLSPCVIQSRYVDEDEEDQTFLYSATLIALEDNPDIRFACALVPNVEYLLRDLPREAIHVLDRPYTIDALQPMAFRHEMHVTDENMYPQGWRNAKRKRIRTRSTSSSPKQDEGDWNQFKRKEPRPPLQRKQPNVIVIED